MNRYKSVQYSVAVILVFSSIAMAFIHEFKHGDIAGGVLIYIAQAFLFAASIFGLDIYVKTIHQLWKQEESATTTR